jgi:hypothetical protein
VSFTCQEGTLVAVRVKGLRPHGDDDGVVGVARVEEKDGNIASGDHFGGGETTGHGDVLQPHRQAALDLDGGGVGATGECLQNSFFIMGC